MTKPINQYYPKSIRLPQAGEIREITDRRTGQVAHLGRVSRINANNRTAEIEIVHLDRRGRELKR